MPSVSPKKTWSGALGGAAGAFVVGLLFKTLVLGYAGSALWFYAIILSIASQAGDLFESAIKRLFNVKDSSQLIPGHGGFLDRVDGLIPVALIVALVILLDA